MVYRNRDFPSVSEPPQITLLSLFFKLSSCARFTCTLLLVWGVARYGLSTPFLKICFLFQILVSLYEPFIFLAFFSHYPDNQQSYEAPHESAASIIFHVQSLLDVFTARVRSPSTLLGLLYFRKWWMGILKTMDLPFFSDTHHDLLNNTRNNIQNLTGQVFFVCKHCWLYLRSAHTLHEPCRGCELLASMEWNIKQGEVCMVAPPLLYVQTKTLIFLLDCHWIIDHAMIFRGWPIPHQLCIVLH